jgi:hypothetical protein
MVRGSSIYKVIHVLTRSFKIKVVYTSVYLYLYLYLYYL